MTQKKHNLNYQEAMEALGKGYKVRLPEWIGYWFKEDDKVKVFNRTGDILLTPDYDSFNMRNDWEVTDGEMGFEFALLALRAGKLVSRDNWHSNDKFVFARPEDSLEAETIVDKVKSIPKAVKKFIQAGMDRRQESIKREEEYSKNAKALGSNNDDGGDPKSQGGYELNADDKIRFTGYFCYHGSDGTIVNGWTPSIIDLNAFDWKVVG
jgi:hypothetical protein